MGGNRRCRRRLHVHDDGLGVHGQLLKAGPSCNILSRITASMVSHPVLRLSNLCVEREDDEEPSKCSQSSLWSLLKAVNAVQVRQGFTTPNDQAPNKAASSAIEARQAQAGLLGGRASGRA
jgi:hypothetical protein